MSLILLLLLLLLLLLRPSGELKRWCPALKVLTYYGSAKERKLKRTGWTKPNAFHVCITSYQLAVIDAPVFRRKKWFYLILDEAQNIKNFRSQRWQVRLYYYVLPRPATSVSFLRLPSMVLGAWASHLLAF